MTKIITIAAQNAPKAVGPYSQARKAVEAEATLYVSGQLPINPATATMPESIEEQTRQSLDNLGAILHEAGMDYSDIVKTFKSVRWCSWAPSFSLAQSMAM